MIVLKFGGTSVGDAERIKASVDIAVEQIDRAPVLVSSAMSGITDALLTIADSATSGDTHTVQNQLDIIRKRHDETAEALSTGKLLEETKQRISTLIDQLESLARGLLLLRECSARTLDTVASLGELLSTTLIHAAATEQHIDSALLDARTFMRTDDQFGSAVPDLEAISELTQSLVAPRKGTLLVTQGFIASTATGVTTTLGRGGSDLTATIIGSALGAEEVQIWTDVHGIMTCDPRIVPEATTIEKLSYSEAAELAYFGAKVVHPSTIQPAIDRSIPVLVKHSSYPNGAFTEIDANTKATGLRAIAGKRSVTLINITSSRMLNAFGFLSQIFNTFDRYKTAVDLIATSEVSVSVTVDDPRALSDISDELTSFATVSSEYHISIVSLVGQDLWKDSAFVAAVFEAIRTIPIRMISLGSSDINLSIVVPESSFAEALRLLHRRFFQ